MKPHPVILALVVGVPLAAGYAALANTLALGDAITIGLYFLVVVIPVVIAAEVDAQDRGVSTRLSRLRHDRSGSPGHVDA